MTGTPPTLTLLYSLDLNPRREIEALYFKYVPPAKGHFAEHRADGVAFVKGTSIEFDTLFGSFFETDWFKYTTIENVVCRIRVTGACSATVYRRTHADETYIAAQGSPDSAGVIEMGFSRHALLPNLPARMWVVVHALSDLTVHELSWLTPDPSQLTSPALSLCLTTFNRPQYLRRVIKDILANRDTLDRLRRIIIVNHGEPFSLTDLVDAPNREWTDRISLFEQSNFGGAGGFTRGIIESLADEAITHILLCDDDIVFEPQSVVRLTSYLKYAKPNVVVGGQMLDAIRPRRLYESGAVLRKQSLMPRPIGHGMPLDESKTLDSFIHARSIDYNGWWYLALSRQVIERVSLPMPCFIRGDDIEYGVRMKRNGIETVVLPGLVIWHEPFYLKLGGWHRYYEVKNRLILAAMHYQRRARKDLNSMLRTFVRDLLNCRYYPARLSILALGDFLQGPDVALTCAPEKLSEVQALGTIYGPKRLSSKYIPIEHCAVSREWGSGWRGTFLLSYVFVKNLLPSPQIRRTHCYLSIPEFKIQNTHRLRRIIVREGDGTTHLLFKRSSRRFWSLLLRFLWLYVTLLARQERLYRTYRGQFHQRCSLAAWRELLALPEPSGPKCRPVGSIPSRNFQAEHL